MPNELCQCDFDERYCDRHQMEKGVRKKQFCRGIANCHGCGVFHWNKWEEGKNGATAPPNPVFNPPGFCKGVVPSPVDTSMLVTFDRKSYVGDWLHLIIERETGAAIPCEDCVNAINELNGLTVEECGLPAKRDWIRDDIYSRAFEKAPSIIQKAMILADKWAGTGQARRVIGGWVDEGIEKGNNPPPGQAKTSSGCRSC